MGTCPLSGRPCDLTPTFVISENLGDKSQTTACCRNCAAYFVQGRNFVSAIGQQQVVVDYGPSLIQPQPTAQQPHKGKKKKRRRPDNSKTCSVCDITFAQIVERKFVGCPRCYEDFKNELTYARNFEGLTFGQLPNDQQIEFLENLMDGAAADEDYDKAAKIRDVIRDIREGV